jgi:hypothetical protein
VEIGVDSWENILPIIKETLSNPEMLLQRQSETIVWWENTVDESSVARFIVERTVETMNGTGHS